MKRYIVLTLVVLALALGFAFTGDKAEPVDSLNPLGIDSENTRTIPQSVTEFDQVGITASASTTGIVKASGGKVYALEITSDSQSIRYFQLFDQIQAVVPARSASISSDSCPYCTQIYAASRSWASATALAAKPLASYAHYASPSLVFSVAIPAATASSSPTIVRIGPDYFSSALRFTKGIMFGISTAYATYASPSAATLPAARVKVKVLYE